MKIKVWLIFLLLPLPLLFLLAFSPSNKEALVLGEFKVSRVIDGDTIAVEGIADTIRFLSIDTEESEKGVDAEEKTREIAKNFQAIVAEITQQVLYPKMNTPMGWEATLFARRHFPIGSKVRIEFDEVGRTKDYYDRMLGYVFFQRDKKWVNYNVECVREGMSPYCDKYGASKRFETEFLQAEREARVHHRGIWAPGAMAYPDYDGRLCWWHRRAQTIQHFEKKYRPQRHSFQMIAENDWKRLKNYVGREVVLFGSLEWPKYKLPLLVIPMHHNNRTALGIRVADPKLYAALEPRLEAYKEEFVYVRGVLEKGFNVEKDTYAFGLTLKTIEQVFVEPAIVVATKPTRIPKAVPKDTKEVHWTDARRYLGDAITLAGQIVKIENSGNIFLYFSPEPDQIHVVILQKYIAQFPQPPEVMFRDHKLRITGKVVKFETKLQIVVTDPKQIEIIE